MALRRLFKRHRTNTLHVVLGVIALVWLGFQVWVPASEQPTILTQVLQVAFGAWLADLAYDQRSQDEKVVDRVDKLEHKNPGIGGRVDRLESVAGTHATLDDLLEAQKRELNANQASLQSMRDIINIKKHAGVPVLPETLRAMEILESQIAALKQEIEQRERGGPPDA